MYFLFIYFLGRKQKTPHCPSKCPKHLNLYCKYTKKRVKTTANHEYRKWEDQFKPPVLVALLKTLY